MGIKIAGIKFIILKSVRFNILNPIPIKSTDPTVVISRITAALSKGARSCANNMSPPWYSSKGIAEKITPIPSDDEKRIAEIPSMTLFVYRVALSPVKPLSSDPTIAIDPIQNSMGAVINAWVNWLWSLSPLKRFVILSIKLLIRLLISIPSPIRIPMTIDKIRTRVFSPLTTPLKIIFKKF